MTTAESQAPEINWAFATTVLNRAADIVESSAGDPDGPCHVIDALGQARDEFLAGESKGENRLRSYGLPYLRRDLGGYIKDRYPEYRDTEWNPISDWSRGTQPADAAQTLRDAAHCIGTLVKERTKQAGILAAMDEGELCEYNLMRKLAAFLTGEGLDVSVQWERKGPKRDPIDYWGTVDGERWAFELTELRRDANGSHRKVRNQRDIERLAEPIPKVPSGAEVLRRAWQKAISHGKESSKLNARSGAKYCLVIHNRQFFFVPDWQTIPEPDLTEFDAVLILHEDNFPPAEVWEVLKQPNFNRRLRSQNVDDMADIDEFKASRRDTPDPELVKSAWAHIESLGLSDEEIQEIASGSREE